MVNDVDPARLRRLAEMRGAGAKVLSIYIDRDPQSFASPRALQSEAHSALDEAARRIEDADLDHEALVAARADVERVRELLLEVDPDERETIDPDLDLKGARGLAIFAGGPADLLEVLKLPAPAPTAVWVDDEPHLEPLFATTSGHERVAVALVDSETARIFYGTADALGEITDDQASRRHREVRDSDVERHLSSVSDDLLAIERTRGFDVLLSGAREEQ